MRTPLLILFFLILFACSEQRIVSEQELKAYILDPENGLRKQKEKNGVDIEVIYRPTELVLAQQLKAITDQRERSSSIANFDSLGYFIVQLSRKGQEIENAYAGDEQQFVSVVNYLSTTIGNNIYIINKSDTIRALDAVYTGTFGASSATSVMAVFDANVRKMNGAFKFYLDDTVLGLGKNEFEFDINDIKKAPTLNLN